MDFSPITRLDLHNKMLEYPRKTFTDRKKHVLEYLKEHFATNGDEHATEVLITFTRENFFSPYLKRWQKVFSKNEVFLARYDDWLREEIVFPELLKNRLTPTSSNTEPTPGPSGTQSTKDFKQYSERHKRRKTEQLREEASAAELSFATSMKLRDEGDQAAAKLLTEATTTTPTRAKRIFQKWTTPDPGQRKYTPEEALALILELNLTREQYTRLKQSADSCGHDLYPPYYKVLEAKRDFYPDGITITESNCEVPLQSLLDKTCESLVKCIYSASDDSQSLKLICKWGFDGSSGYSKFKQTSDFTSSSELQAEGNLLVMSLVPLRLVKENNELLWKNPRPSSKLFCRPVKLLWIKETDEVSRQLEQDMNNQINNLSPCQTEHGKISFTLLLTMVDGKVCNAITETTSAMRCFMCKATISEMNEIDELRTRKVQKDTLKFGLSVLHAYIRFFECLLHISYRLEVKVWKVKKEMKDAVDRRKKYIQQQFRDRMGVLVDIPKQSAGNTNDGNTARRFFANLKLQELMRILLRDFPLF